MVAACGRGTAASEDGERSAPFRVAVTGARKAAKRAVGADRADRCEWLADRALDGSLPGDVVVFAAYEEWHSQKAWLSERQWRRLHTALELADRYADFGAGRRGAGASHVVDLMLFPDATRRLSDPQRPWKSYGLRAHGREESLCLYVVELLHEARRWRAAERARRQATVRPSGSPRGSAA